MSFDQTCYFELSKRILFIAANTEATAESLGYSDSSEIVFKRTAEYMIELTDSIEKTLNSGLIRPSYSLLRTALEVCTSFAWLTQDFENRLERFESGSCPSPQKMMSSANLGWHNEYKYSYKPFSNFVHGSFILSELNKKVDVYEKGDEIPDSITSDLYFSLVESKVIIVDNKSTDKLIEEHKPFIEIKTFDIVLAMLMRASGDYSDSFNWWPGREQIENFSEKIKCIDRDDHFLWAIEKKRLAINKVEGVYN